MAYGNNNTPPGGNEEEKDQGEGTGGNEEVIYEVGGVSFVDEPISQDKPDESIVGLDEPYIEPIDPIPSPISGQIKFQKTIYSQNVFRQKVDVSISELKPKEEEIDISGFFRQYHKIFFDIPKTGFTSHDSLIKESMDYMNDFKDPKDEQIRYLEEQVIALTTQVNELTIGSGDDASSAASDIINEAEAIAKAPIEIGPYYQSNPSDPRGPNIYWNNDPTRVLHPDGLLKAAEDYDRSQGIDEPRPEDLPGNFELTIENRPIVEALTKIYNEGAGGSNTGAGENIRVYSLWKVSIENLDGNIYNKVAALNLLENVRDFITQTYDDIMEL